MNKINKARHKLRVNMLYLVGLQITSYVSQDENVASHYLL